MRPSCSLVLVVLVCMPVVILASPASARTLDEWPFVDSSFRDPFRDSFFDDSPFRDTSRDLDDLRDLRNLRDLDLRDVRSLDDLRDLRDPLRDLGGLRDLRDSRLGDGRIRDPFDPFGDPFDDPFDRFDDPFRDPLRDDLRDLVRRQRAQTSFVVQERPQGAILVAQQGTRGDLDRLRIEFEPGRGGTQVEMRDSGVLGGLTRFSTRFTTIIEYDDVNDNGVFDRGDRILSRLPLTRLRWIVDASPASGAPGESFTARILTLADVGITMRADVFGPFGDERNAAVVPLLPGLLVPDVPESERGDLSVDTVIVSLAVEDYPRRADDSRFAILATHSLRTPRADAPAPDWPATATVDGASVPVVVQTISADRRAGDRMHEETVYLNMPAGESVSLEATFPVR